MRDTIVIGASAGGIRAVGSLVEQLPRSLPASILVTIHSSASAPNVLAQIFMNRGKLEASSPMAAEPLAHGRIYVACPDHHLELMDGMVRSTRGPRMNGSRPAIDVLFRSAAKARGDRVIAVMLTGMLDDGVGGLLEIRSRGGIAVVQDPDDAAYPMLPRNAIDGAGADYVVPVSEMGALLVKLVTGPASGGGKAPPKKGDSGKPDEQEDDMPSRKHGPAQNWSSPEEASPEGGVPSVFSCPECHGVLSKTGPDDLPRFVCRVGHAYDPQTLLAQDEDAAEEALWAAIRSTEECLSLSRKLLVRARAVGDRDQETELDQRARRAERQVASLRSALEGDTGAGEA